MENLIRKRLRKEMRDIIRDIEILSKYTEGGIRGLEKALELIIAAAEELEG
jgi:hypothetical protein